MRKRKNKRLKATSLWVQQVEQKMTNGRLQPLVFHRLFIVEEYIPKRPRRIKVTETINPTRYKATSQVQGGPEEKAEKEVNNQSQDDEATQEYPRNGAQLNTGGPPQGHVNEQ